MTDKTHGLIVKTHWKRALEDLRSSLRSAQKTAEKQAPDPASVFAWRAGIVEHAATAALDLLAEVLAAAEEAEGALPLQLGLGHHLVVDGTSVRVINAWVETDDGHGRKRWGIVTEESRSV